jgi:hypothetical protein
MNNRKNNRDLIKLIGLAPRADRRMFEGVENGLYQSTIEGFTSIKATADAQTVKAELGNLIMSFSNESDENTGIHSLSLQHVASNDNMYTFSIKMFYVEPVTADVLPDDEYSDYSQEGGVTELLNYLWDAGMDVHETNNDIIAEIPQEIRATLGSYNPEVTEVGVRHLGVMESFIPEHEREIVIKAIAEINAPDIDIEIALLSNDNAPAYTLKSGRSMDLTDVKVSIDFYDAQDKLNVLDMVLDIEATSENVEHQPTSPHEADNPSYSDEVTFKVVNVQSVDLTYEVKEDGVNSATNIKDQAVLDTLTRIVIPSIEDKLLGI